MRKFHLFLFVCILSFSACTLKPSLKLKEASYTAKEQAFLVDKQWWRAFNDEDLNALMQEALKNNTDLKIAFVRFEMAAENLGIDRSALFPKADGSASGTRARTPKNLSGAREGSISNQYSLGLNLSYELDLWGKLRDQWGAASKAYEASALDFEVARLSLSANVAKLYFNAINLARQVEILEKSVQSYEETYLLKSEQYNVGTISEYELYNFKAQLDSAKAQLVSAKLNKDANEKALTILVSSDFDKILYSSFDKKEIQKFNIDLPEGISSGILLQRPDVAAALKRLEQSNYLVGVARAAFLPSISLTGLLGYQSRDLDTLVKAGSGAWSAGASFAMPIFHWGEIKSNVNLAKLAKDEAFLNYENTLKTAFSEIRTALINRQGAYENEVNYANLLSAQEKIYSLAQIRYESGSISLNDLLDAQRNYLNAQINFVNSNYEVLSSLVEVFKNFGGGFNTKEDLEDNTQENAKNLDMSFRE
ncbi:TolC family protein [Campylobacter sp. MIT 99-7217]|uniref:efflux transporter outer membrane subunit n=1 Tax=Campylobacter sp. MIT 99-7217 TaxID=535091 RepID=UPI001159A7C2|nr:TolC family protein [Campylobacter sp. MIT 99-7217]TQR33842.1 TolC family protein [Campylobacter sp. MIT 99-7217]